jgi:hypothetical protein
MNARLKPIASVFALACLAACGGGGSSDGESTQSGLAALQGTYWYSSATNVRWLFRSSGSGEMYQGSTDGSSCEFTALNYTATSSSVTYTVTNVKGFIAGYGSYSGTPSQVGVSAGPFSASYSVSGSSATIGNGTYTQSNYLPTGCDKL